MKVLKWTESCKITQEAVTIEVGVRVFVKGSRFSHDIPSCFSSSKSVAWE